jgi:hypothetical protein
VSSEVFFLNEFRDLSNDIRCGMGQFFILISCVGILGDLLEDDVSSKKS